MKIVEIIVLMGTQCVSPIQHTPSMTEVSKVQCAVVIEKDSVTNTVEVSPPAAVNHPTVSEAMARLSKQSLPAVAAVPAAQPFRIVPAAVAPREAEAQVLPPKPLEPASVPDAVPEIARPAPVGQPQADPPADTDIASLQPQPEAAAGQDAAVAEPEAKPKAESKTPKPGKTTSARKPRTTKSATAAKLPDRCSGNAVAKWYTSKNGHKKYRCVKGSGTSAKPKVAKAKKGLY